MRVRYCPTCGELLQRQSESRFVHCPEHGKLLINVTEFNQ